MSKQQEEIDQLKAISSALFEPFTNQVTKILTDMQTSIDKLSERVDSIEKKQSALSEMKTETKYNLKISSPTPKNKLPDDDDTKLAYSTTTPADAKARKSPRASPRSSPRAKSPRSSKRKSRLGKRGAKEEKKEEKVFVEDGLPEKKLKERGDKKKINWSFQSDHNIISNGDNGSSATKPKFKPGSIKFGKFVEQKDSEYASYQFKFDTRALGSTASGYAFGVCSKGFNLFGQSNFGDNGCVMIKGNGQFITSDSFRNNRYEHKKIVEEFKENGLCKEGDVVVVEIDVEMLLMRIWNETRDDSEIFIVALPNKPVNCLIYLAGSAKRKVSVLEQFAYKFIEKEE